MNEEYPRSEWYDQSLPEQGGSGTKQSPRRPGQRGGLKAAMLVVCVLVLIAASVYVFTDRASFGTPAASGAFSVPVRPTPRAREGADDFEDDFRSFFDDYYSKSDDEETFSGSSLKRTAGDPEAALRINPVGSRPELSLQELYAGAVDSIVGIKAGYKDSFGYGWGTGVVMRSDGYILTNEHVIDGADTATVVLPDGSEYDALLIGEDTQTDLAVLKIEAKDLAPAEFGDSAGLAVGDRVVAIGNPLGDELTGTMTDGIISAINRDIQVNGRRMTLLQTNAALNEGNSGGPLYNIYGQVIGITNMKMVNSYSSVTIEGIGFAIPTSTVKSVTDQLIAGGEVAGRPGLGITLGNYSDAIAERYDLPGGLYVVSVSDASDAKAKGLVPGDVVTHVNGQPVSSTEDVLKIRDESQVGDILVLTVWRDGQSFDMSVVLRDLNDLN